MLLSFLTIRRVVVLIQMIMERDNGVSIEDIMFCEREAF